MTREAQHTSAVFSDHSSHNKIQSKCLACMFKKILWLMCFCFRYHGWWGRELLSRESGQKGGISICRSSFFGIIAASVITHEFVAVTVKSLHEKYIKIFDSSSTTRPYNSFSLLVITESLLCDSAGSSEMKFGHINIGWNRKVHDVRVLVNS